MVATGPADPEFNTILSESYGHAYGLRILPSLSNFGVLKPKPLAQSAVMVLA